MSKEKQIEEMARQNCHIEYHMKNYKTCKECYETNYCACRVYEVCRNLYNAGYRQQSEGEWISVEERLPDNGETVLTVDNEGYMIVASWYELGGWFLPVCRANPVTHWMPMPEPPVTKGA